MQVASLDLCKQLFELSGWVTDDFWQWIEAHQGYELNNGDSFYWTEDFSTPEDALASLLIRLIKDKDVDDVETN